ncbi:MAG: hypothetical protein B1H03_07515 [Planctomycetales bacterium 4484_113]|nr:MAG: hypothetical protein B1H03_07515 [Planctomycetales bacterium 4484_113]
MSLIEMLQRGDIEELPAGKQEIEELITKAERRLEETSSVDVYEDMRLELAYLSILYCATAALRASGFRVTRGEGHHVRTLETLKHTLRVPSEKVDYYQNLRKARNVGLYDKLLDVSKVQLHEAIEEAGNLLRETRSWLREHHPELIE